MALKNAFLLPLIFCLASAGCTYSKKSPDEVKADAFDEVSRKMRESTLDTREAALSYSDLQVYFESGSVPNEYSFVIKTPKKVPQISVVVGARGVIQRNDTDIIKVPVAWTEVKIRVFLSILTKDNIKATDLDLGYFEVPRDLVIDGKFNLEKDTHFTWSYNDSGPKNYHKVIFKEGATLTTNGFNLSFETNSLIFEGKNAILLSDRYNKKSRDNIILEPLKDGSDINISAKKILGNAIIYMTGVSGKEGHPAQYIAYQMKPSPFQQAKDGMNGLDSKVQEVMKMSQGLDTTPMSEFVCLSQPTNGTDGADGIIVHGEDGEDGTDTGNLTIKAEDYSQAKIRIFLVPGKGGSGGQGNFEGQKGGKGGAAGRGGNPCKTALAGKNGRDSTIEDSKPGKDGVDGRLGVLDIPQDTNHFEVFYEPR